MIFREFRNDGKSYDIAIFANEAGKYQYVNLTKEKICPCEFDSYEAAFADLLKYINQGKINGLSFKQDIYADISVEKKNGMKKLKTVKRLLNIGKLKIIGLRDYFQIFPKIYRVNKEDVIFSLDIIRKREFWQ